MQNGPIEPKATKSTLFFLFVFIHLLCLSHVASHWKQCIPSQRCPSCCWRKCLPVYTPFGDGEGRGYTIHLLFDVCQSHQQKSAAQMPQIFDNRSMSVSHTTRNLRHICHRIFLNLSVVHHLAGISMKSAARMPQIFCQIVSLWLQHACQKLISGKHVLDYKRCLYINVKFNNWEKYATCMPQIYQWIVYIFMYTWTIEILITYMLQTLLLIATCALFLGRRSKKRGWHLRFITLSCCSNRSCIYSNCVISSSSCMIFMLCLPLLCQFILFA
jgi:hypothetical protein